MPADRSSPGGRLARRRFLGALAVAPAALAGCASSGSARRGSAGPGQGAPATPHPPAPDAAIRAVRELALPAEAEPAFVFRAGTARPGEP